MIPLSDVTRLSWLKQFKGEAIVILGLEGVEVLGKEAGGITTREGQCGN